ncbi:MAG: InlB B-repeat-containing protein [Prevotella sp.]|nr:InlB B-repeat-containing protein [Staphylococcus sp.]MCM1350032.1 InlB B-repeat-containing protein [Prevotella sp.]
MQNWRKIVVRLIVTIVCVGCLTGCSSKNKDKTTKYQIHYHSNVTLTLDLPSTYTKDEIVQLPEPSMEGYRFLGWYSNSDYTGSAIQSIDSSWQKDLDLYAKWEKLYQIRYQLDGGTFSEEVPNEYSSLEKVILPIPQKQRAIFKGWYFDINDLQSAVETIDKGNMEDITLYAKWEKTYIVTLRPEGGMVSESTIEFTKEDELTLEVPQKENSIFLGWYDNYDFEGMPIEKIERGRESSIILYAKWMEICQITYHFNEGILSVDYPTYYIPGEETLLPTLSKQGYQFLGWSEYADGSGNIFSKVPVSYEEDLELYAVFEKVFYRIEYVIGENIFTSKQQLFISFFSDFYDYIVNYRHASGQLERNNVRSLEDFLSIAGAWSGGGAGMGAIGNLAGSFYLGIDVGGKLEDQTADQGFIGYCLEKNKYVEFIYFLQEFFYHWRKDEGYTGGPDDPNHTGSDFLASAWASLVDTAKFFYYEKDTLPSYFIKKGNIPAMYDRIPYVLGEENPELPYQYDWEKGLDLPVTLTMAGYRFIGWYDNPNYSGDALIRIPSHIFSDIKVYAKWEKVEE